MKMRLTDEELKKDFDEFAKITNDLIKKKLLCPPDEPYNFKDYKKNYHELKDYDDAPNYCSKCKCKLDFYEKEAEVCLPCSYGEEE